MVKETKWWKDNRFIDELDKRYSAWESGKEKGYTLSEVKASIVQLKHKNSFPEYATHTFTNHTFKQSEKI
jgi:hypothetical protein